MDGMTEFTPDPIEPTTSQVVADPSRPYKAVAAAVVAAVSVLITQGQDVLPAWALLVLAALVAGLLTYVVPNPITVKETRP